MAEEWRAVVGYEGWYEVSDLGRVKRIRKANNTYAGRIISGRICGRSYIQVCLSRNAVRKDVKVHKIVAALFIGPCPDGKEINHKDGNKLNNAVSNLEYVTHKGNMHHASLMGLYASQVGEDNTSAKLTEADVHDVRRRLRYETMAAIAKSKGVCKQTISNIANGITWAHLQEEPS